VYIPGTFASHILYLGPDNLFLFWQNSKPRCHGLGFLAAVDMQCDHLPGKQSGKCQACISVKLHEMSWTKSYQGKLTENFLRNCISRLLIITQYPITIILWCFLLSFAYQYLCFSFQYLYLSYILDRVA